MLLRVVPLEKSEEELKVKERRNLVPQHLKRKGSDLKEQLNAIREDDVSPSSPNYLQRRKHVSQIDKVAKNFRTSENVAPRFRFRVRQNQLRPGTQSMLNASFGLGTGFGESLDWGSATNTSTLRQAITPMPGVPRNASPNTTLPAIQQGPARSFTPAPYNKSLQSLGGTVDGRSTAGGLPSRAATSMDHRSTTAVSHLPPSRQVSTSMSHALTVHRSQVTRGTTQTPHSRHGLQSRPSAISTSHQSKHGRMSMSAVNSPAANTAATNQINTATYVYNELTDFDRRSDDENGSFAHGKFSVHAFSPPKITVMIFHFTTLRDGPCATALNMIPYDQLRKKFTAVSRFGNLSKSAFLTVMDEFIEVRYRPEAIKIFDSFERNSLGDISISSFLIGLQILLNIATPADTLRYCLGLIDLRSKVPRYITRYEIQTLLDQASKVLEEDKKSGLAQVLEIIREQLTVGDYDYMGRMPLESFFKAIESTLEDAEQELEEKHAEEERRARLARKASRASTVTMSRKHSTVSVVESNVSVPTSAVSQ